MSNGYIFDIKRFAVHDGPGIRTTVFFKGCPLNCIWCHNPEGIRRAEEIAYLGGRCVLCGACGAACPKGLHTLEDGAHRFSREGCALCFRCATACPTGALKHYGLSFSAGELLERVLADRDFYFQSGGGVTCSGGEPMAQAAFVAELLALLKREGIHTAVDTSGFAPWAQFEAVLPYTDIFLYDLKHMNAQKHKALTGVSNDIILDNFMRLARHGATIEVRLPIIPNINDDETNLRQTAEWIARGGEKVSVRPLIYHALSGSKYEALGKTHSLPPENGRERACALRAADIFEAFGIRCIRPE